MEIGMSQFSSTTTWPCFHRAFMENTCVFCNKSKVDCGDPATTRFCFIDPSLSLTHDAIHLLRNNNLRMLLNSKKLHLILDLDHTLIHAVLEINNPNNDDDDHASSETIKLSGGDHVSVKLRPGAREFLDQASSMFDLSVYTMGSRAYANRVVEILGGRSKFVWVIAREDCVKHGQKNLDVVLAHRQVVLIVDDTVGVWEESCRANLIKIDRFNYSFEGTTGDTDRELSRVFDVLKVVHSLCYDADQVINGTRDVREVLKLLSSGPVLGGGSQELGCCSGDQERYDGDQTMIGGSYGRKRSRSDNINTGAPYQQNVCVPTKRSNKLGVDFPRLVL